MASKEQPSFQDFLPLMAEKLGGDGLIGELCNGFQLLMDSDKGVITFESLKKNSVFLGLQDFSDDDLYSMLKEGDFDGDGALNQMEFCVLMFRLSPELMLESQFLLEEALQQEGDGETLVSNGGRFELGFFSPGSSTDRYLGIWYKNIPIRTIVWVANRQNPVKDLSGSFTINQRGSLVLSNGTDSVVWSTVFIRPAQDLVLQLLDSGNLALRDNRDENTDIYLWESFDYPTDTLLPGMKLGWNLRTSFNRHLSAWKSVNDPSLGELTLGIELDPYSQSVMLKGTRKFFRGGPWNGLRFSGAPELKTNPVFSFRFVSNQDEVYYTYQLLNTSVITRLVLNETTSSRQRYVWNEADQSWRIYASLPRDYCDNYGLCGGNGICVLSDSPVCHCLKGFRPRSSQSWNAIDWSSGCVRDEPLECSRNNDFVRFSGLKLPDTVNSWVNNSLNLRQCREECLKNCSCIAYANSNISGRGNGCVLWFEDLVDIRRFSDGGQDLYIRMPASKENRSLVIAASTVISITSIFGMLLVIYCICSGKRSAKDCDSQTYDMDQKTDLDLPFLELAGVINSTDNFSENNKLGEGGFGPVYKGLLVDDQNVAVKRLSKSSRQGLDEFKNEIKLIVKLQHRNLVRRLGCCIEGDEKILIYEYMPNGSLDSFIFDKTRGSQLDWSKRFNIICGIARGLVYLHQDSRLRIIHRDLKASNVLLDDDLNPKISDFGLARTFGGDQSEDNTKRIVGTYGYMAPEYAVYGLFSVKSDVFSFGILLLEIVSGKKNRGLNHEHNHHNLIGYAWKLWTDKKPLELIDSILDDMLIQSEMIRCIHVGLLCVQLNPEDRPTMPTALLMLIGEKMLPQPKQPGLLIDFIPRETSSSSSKNNTCSINGLTITTMEAR